MKYLVIVLTSLIFSCSDSKNSKQDIKSSQTSDKLRLIEEKDIKDKNLNELRLVRNEIFARHGYIFKSEELTNHFSKMDWYNPRFTNVNSRLTHIDSLNIQLILKKENELQANLPQNLYSDDKLLEALDKVIRDSVDSFDKDFFQNTINIINQFAGKMADTTILQICQVDGLEGLDTLKTRISHIKDEIVVTSSFSKNGTIWWTYHYKDPYFIVSDLDQYPVINSSNKWIKFSYGIIRGAPDIQDIFSSQINFNQGDRKFVEYLKNYKGIYIAPGQPIDRDGLYTWDEFNKTFRLIYRP
jgi:hypothetical protein